MDRFGRFIAAIFLLCMCSIIIAMVATGAAEAKEHKITCDPEKSDCDGLIGKELESGDVVDGDVIALDGPFFSEDNLTISKGVTLRGINTSMVLYTYSLSIAANGTRIEDMKIFMNSGMSADGVNNWSLDRVTVSLYLGQNTNGALRVRDSSGWSVRDSRLEYFYRNDGIIVENGSSFLLSSVVFMEGGGGVHVSGSRDFTITGCYFESVVTGIYVQGSENATIDMGMFFFDEYGIVLMGTVNSTVRDCGLFRPMSDTGIMGFGVVLDGADGSSVINATIMYNNYGVAVNYTTNASIRQNTISNNLVGLAVLASPGIVIKDNAFVDPIDDPTALLVKYSSDGGGTAQLDAKGNFWSFPSAMRLYDLVEGNVDISSDLATDPTPDAPPVAIKQFPASFTMMEDEESDILLLSDYYSDETWYWVTSSSQQYSTVTYTGGNTHIELTVGKYSCSGDCIGSPYQVSVRAKDGWNGEQAASIKMTDWRGKSTTTPLFTIKVTPANDPPAIDISLADLDGTRVVGRNGQEVRFNYTIYDDGSLLRVEARLGDSPWQVLEESAQCMNASGAAGQGMPACTKGTYTVEFTDEINGTMKLYIRATEKYGTSPNSTENFRTIVFNNLSLSEGEGGIYDIWMALLGILLLAALVMFGAHKGEGGVVKEGDEREDEEEGEEKEEEKETEDEAEEEEEEEEEKEEEADEKDEEDEAEGEEEEEKDDAEEEDEDEEEEEG